VCLPSTLTGYVASDRHVGDLRTMWDKVQRGVCQSAKYPTWYANVGACRCVSYMPIGRDIGLPPTGMGWIANDPPVYRTGGSLMIHLFSKAGYCERASLNRCVCMCDEVGKGFTSRFIRLWDKVKHCFWYVCG